MFIGGGEVCFDLCGDDAGLARRGSRGASANVPFDKCTPSAATENKSLRLNAAVDG